MHKQKDTKKRMNLKVFPELWIIIFGFLLNYPWEMLQAPLFKKMADGNFWETTKHCTIAALGDVVILFSCYWIVSVFSNAKRSWVINPKKGEIGAFLSIGLVITIVFEIIAIEALGLWAYQDSMPTVLSIGLSPLLQWIILPIFILYLFHRIYPIQGAFKVAP